MLSIESRPDSYGTSKSEQKKEEDEMNKVILMGRLTKAPEIKDLQDDNKTAMARYTLAVDRRYGKDREREADFIPCVTFGKNAEFAEIYLKKGTKIVISGRIRTGSYTDSEGVKRYSSNVVVEEHFFAKARKHPIRIQRMRTMDL